MPRARAPYVVGIDGFLDPVFAKVADGKIAYHAGVAGACVAAIAGSSCDAFGFPEERVWCQGAFIGTIPNTSACDGDDECSSHVCNFGVSCAATSAVGEPCASAPCRTDLICDSATDLCATRRLAGASCDDDSECESGECGAGGTCANDPVCPAGA